MNNLPNFRTFFDSLGKNRNDFKYLGYVKDNDSDRGLFVKNKKKTWEEENTLNRLWWWYTGSFMLGVWKVWWTNQKKFWFYSRVRFTWNNFDHLFPNGMLMIFLFLLLSNHRSSSPEFIRKYDSEISIINVCET